MTDAVIGALPVTLSDELESPTDVRCGGCSSARAQVVGMVVIAPSCCLPYSRR
jgi:hypothetical protein